MKNTTLKTALLAAALTLAAAAVHAQTTLGYDRPSSTPQHQHVVYWNDSMNHYDMDVQVAADAYSSNDIYDKRDSREKKPHNHKTRKTEKNAQD